jgi:hypothetical protein
VSIVRRGDDDDDDDGGDGSDDHIVWDYDDNHQLPTAALLIRTGSSVFHGFLLTP